MYISQLCIYVDNLLVGVVVDARHTFLSQNSPIKDDFLVITTNYLAAVVHHDYNFHHLLRATGQDIAVRLA